jgi:hypothetical protein
LNYYLKIPLSIRIIKESFAIRGLFIEFSIGWWPLDRTLIINWLLNELSKARGEIGRSFIIKGSLEVARLVSGLV